MLTTYLSRLTSFAVLSLCPVTLLCAGELLDLKLDRVNGAVTATLRLSAHTDISDFPLSEPHRYVVDLASTVPAPDYRSPIIPERSLVLAVREGAQADGRLRLVFDLRAPVDVTLESPPTERSGSGYRVKLTLLSKGQSAGRAGDVAEAGDIAPEATPSSGATEAQDRRAVSGAGAQYSVTDGDRRAEDTDVLDSEIEHRDAVEPEAQPIREWRARLPADYKKAKDS